MTAIPTDLSPGEGDVKISSTVKLLPCIYSGKIVEYYITDEFDDVDVFQMVTLSVDELNALAKHIPVVQALLDLCGRLVRSCEDEDVPYVSGIKTATSAVLDAEVNFD